MWSADTITVATCSECESNIVVETHCTADRPTCITVTNGLANRQQQLTTPTSKSVCEGDDTRADITGRHVGPRALTADKCVAALTVDTNPPCYAQFTPTHPT